MEEEENKRLDEDIIDDDIVAFFDLLAQYDFEDQKKAGLLPPENLKE